MPTLTELWQSPESPQSHALFNKQHITAFVHRCWHVKWMISALATKLRVH